MLKIEERFNAGNAQRKVFGKIKGRPNKNIEVIHHSDVKGMKWGVRNGPPYPIKNNGKVAKALGHDHIREKYNFYYERRVIFMIFYLKGNEIFEELLQLCRVYQLPTPIIGLERFKDFDIWVVVIDNNKKAEAIADYLNISHWSYNILKIVKVNKGAQR